MLMSSVRHRLFLSNEKPYHFNIRKTDHLGIAKINFHIEKPSI